MTFTYTLDLSRYTENQVALMMVEGVITREEFELWRASKMEPVKVEYTMMATKPRPTNVKFG